MKKKGVVLVCVTPQLACKRLIETGRAIADNEGASVRILTVFPQRQCYNPDLNALEALNEAAIKNNAAMTVCFNDSAVKCIAQYASEPGTIKVVVGFPRENSSEFITKFHSVMPEIPLCMVDDDSTAYEITTSDDSKDELLAAKNRDLNSLTYKFKV